MWEFLHLPTEEDELVHSNWYAHPYGSIGTFTTTGYFGTSARMKSKQLTNHDFASSK
jgi:hypothetical protein